MMIMKYKPIIIKHINKKIILLNIIINIVLK